MFCVRKIGGNKTVAKERKRERDKRLFRGKILRHYVKSYLL
jgi:hypothetical protein